MCHKLYPPTSCEHPGTIKTIHCPARSNEEPISTSCPCSVTNQTTWFGAPIMWKHIKDRDAPPNMRDFCCTAECCKTSIAVCEEEFDERCHELQKALHGPVSTAGVRMLEQAMDRARNALGGARAEHHLCSSRRSLWLESKRHESCIPCVPDTHCKHQRPTKWVYRTYRLPCLVLLIRCTDENTYQGTAATLLQVPT